MTSIEILKIIFEYLTGFQEIEGKYYVSFKNNSPFLDTIELDKTTYDELKKKYDSRNCRVNSSTRSTMENFEMLSDCAESAKYLPMSNWCEYADNETELDYQLWRAYEDLKSDLEKYQKQEKVLKAIKGKDLFDPTHKYIFDYSKEYTTYCSMFKAYKLDEANKLTEDEFILSKRCLEEI